MASNITVNLSIKTQATTDYTRATDGSGGDIDYWYLFSGGNQGKKDGSVRVTKKKNKTTVTVVMAKDSKDDFEILTAFWKSIPTNDVNIDSKGPNKLKIVNKAEVIGSNSYTVIATPKGGGIPLILCDPMIINDWGGGGGLANSNKKSGSKKKGNKKQKTSSKKRTSPKKKASPKKKSAVKKRVSKKPARRK